MNTIRSTSTRTSSLRAHSTRMFAVLALAAVGMAACGDDDGDADEPPATEAAADPSDTATTAPSAGTDPATDATEPATGGLQVVDSSLGPVLADAQGLTLYVFTNDTAGESTCFDDCEATWPPAVGEPTTVEGVELGAITRPDGTSQLTIDDRPLYTFAGDAAPGDVNGQGVGEVWFAVSADGEVIS